ncbi:MAG TPA: DUF2231 domain-containing protein [Gammaproteobacteria bacterium]
MATHLERNPRSIASIAGHPIHPMLVQFPISFFIAVFICDLAFRSTGDTGLVTASGWLLAGGLVTAVLAGGVLRSILRRRLRSTGLHLVRTGAGHAGDGGR